MTTDRDRRLGRRTKPARAADTSPGTIFLLAILSAVPIFVLFILGLIINRDARVPPMVAWPTWRWIFLVGTPALAAWALLLHRKAPAWAREHNAARAGRNLAYMVLALWALQALLYVLFLRDLAATA